jgi:hypothetical protein
MASKLTWERESEPPCYSPHCLDKRALIAAIRSSVIEAGTGARRVSYHLSGMTSEERRAIGEDAKTSVHKSSYFAFTLLGETFQVALSAPAAPFSFCSFSYDFTIVRYSKYLLLYSLHFCCKLL